MKRNLFTLLKLLYGLVFFIVLQNLNTCNIHVHCLNKNQKHLKKDNRTKHHAYLFDYLDDLNEEPIGKQKNLILINQEYCNLTKIDNNFSTLPFRRKSAGISSSSEKTNKKYLMMRTNERKVKSSFKDNIVINNTSANITISNTTTKLQTSTNSSQMNKTETASTSTNNSSTSLLNAIADESELIKNEICMNCLEISSTLDILIGEIKEIKNNLRKIIDKYQEGSSIIFKNSSNTNISDNIKDSKVRQHDITEVLNSLNRVNYIKADLFKMNEVLNILQKAECENYQDNNKKYLLVINSSNKLVEIIQDVFRRLNLNINLVVLS
jgi:hypothetical protein